MDGTGTITTFSPDGNMMTVRTSSSAEPITYYYTPQTVVVDPTGATVQLSALRPDTITWAPAPRARMATPRKRQSGCVKSCIAGRSRAR